ncbi:sulfite exporter TauE/SafE family protein [Salinisphaera sp. T31B1]|uniref:sulfite exporter TauE/SafE family protein n=1 Tax=Salinisphaera sp. T31B1 TaxID=727963 RepID=UPI0033428EA3
MQKLLLFGIAGFIAQLVDGAIGMGYGLTSSSILLALGVTPAVASASIHLAEIATTAASGTSHYRLGNVDTRLVRRMLLPGVVGAFSGACFLSWIPGTLIKPYVSIFLLGLGIFILATYLRERSTTPASSELPRWKLIPLSLVAGFFDSVGGGGWGPISTPVLMAHKGIEPRKVIGSVDTSEFAVTIAGTLGFLVALGVGQINWTWVAIFAVSGLFAAPLAAWLVRIMPAQILGVVIGGAIVLINLNTLTQSFDVQIVFRQALLIGALLFWVGALLVILRRHRQPIYGDSH